MPARFYAAWAVAVLVALVLPVLLPYAMADNDGSACAQRVKTDAVKETPFIHLPVPLDVRVDSCSGSSAGTLRYRGEVTARGPYGVPFASATVSTGEYESLFPNERLFIGLAALAVGVMAVSLPFALLALLHTLERRPALAT